MQRIFLSALMTLVLVLLASPRINWSQDSIQTVRFKIKVQNLVHSGGTEWGRSCYHGDRLTWANNTSKFSSSSETGSRRRIQNRPRVQMTALNCDNTGTSKTTSVAARTLLLRRSTAIQLLLLLQ